MEIDDIFERLRALIGREVHYSGRYWVLIDVLADEGQLILRSRGGSAPIQMDQFGRPSRRAGETRQIAVLTQDESELSPELLDILALLRRQP